MIKNYLKSAFHSLWHRKWNSLLTLVSIAISLVVVICVASFWNMLSSPMRPEVNKARTFYLQKSFFKKDNHEPVSYDIAKEIIPEVFYDEAIRKMERIEQVSLISESGWGREFILDGHAKRFDIRITDAQFFEIFKFVFVDGNPYTETMLETGNKLLVVSEEVALYFFGTPYCSGKTINSGSTVYYISGVFKKPPHLAPIQAEVYIGLSSSKMKNQLPIGDLETVFLCSSENDFDFLKLDLENLGKKYSTANDNYEVQMEIKTSVEKIITEHYRAQGKRKINYISIILLILVLPFVALFELLKNNINTRMEELGIRKAFGASNVKIINQLVFENVLVTILGGIFGLVIAFFFFKLISGNSLGDLAPYFFDWRAFIYYLSTFILMGIIAGIIPAIQFSKMPVVKALNQNQS